MGEVPSWINAVVAFLALALSGWTAWQNWKTKKRTTDLEARSAELAKAQTALAHQSWSDDYFRETTDWASGVAGCLSKAIHVLGCPQFDERDRIQILSEISSAIDTGRWYFPNNISDNFGDDKPPAYQGYRQPILDWLVYAYEIFANAEDFDAAKIELVRSQRIFVSYVQERLDPRRREAAINRILAEFDGLSELPQVGGPKTS